MKVAVSALGTTLDAQIDPRFGRCQNILIVDVDTMKVVKTIANENIAASGGAGIKTAQTVAHEGVGAVITGNLGPSASQVLGAAGIMAITSVSGKVSEAIKQYKKGMLKTTKSPTVGAHHGVRL